MRLALLIVAVLSYAAPLAAAAPPTLGPDCGTGASVVGSKNAGKVTRGVTLSGGIPDTCTLTFTSPWPKTPSCAATNETNTRNDGNAVPLGSVSTATTLTINDFSAFWDDGDVLSYLCVGQ